MIWWLYSNYSFLRVGEFHVLNAMEIQKNKSLGHKFCHGTDKKDCIVGLSWKWYSLDVRHQWKVWAEDDSLITGLRDYCFTQ